MRWERESEQPHERRGSQMISIDRVTDKTLAEAERKAGCTWIVPMKQAGEIWRMAGV